MARLRDRDWLVLMAGVREIHESRDLDEMADAAMAVIGRLVPHDLIAYNELNPNQRRALVRWGDDTQERASRAILPQFLRLMPQHPILNYYTRRPHGGVKQMSDFLTRQEWSGHTLFNEVYRHLDGHHHIVLPIPADSESTIGVALNRRLSDFTERERLILTLLKPHLSVAYKTLVAKQRARNLIEGRNIDRSREDLERIGLTAREAEALAWVMQGKTNPEIAVILDLSSRTVDKHMENIFRKLGVASRTGAMLAVLERLQGG